jgi:hypothetical protein
MRQVKKIDVHIGKVPLHNEAEISRRIAYRRKEKTVERVEVSRQPKLKSRLDYRADEGAEARICMLNVQSVTRAIETYGQHAAGMDDLDRSVDGKVSDGFSIGMLRFPLSDRCEVQVVDYLFWKGTGDG